jgi:hypothetical protein
MRLRRLLNHCFVGAVLSFADARSAGGQATAQPRGDVEKAIVESPGITLQQRSGRLALRSLHLEIRAAQPRFDPGKKQALMDAWTLTADLEDDNVSVACHVKAGGTGEARTVQGWIIGEGRPGGVPYQRVDGKLVISPALQHQCWARAYAWTPALSAAASGHKAAGEERIDGRLADKFVLAAGAKALDHVRPLMNLDHAKGTVWLDRETGALLKAHIGYRANFAETRGSDKAVAAGEGHVEMLVSRVGKVKVKIPE